MQVYMLMMPFARISAYSNSSEHLLHHVPFPKEVSESDLGMGVRNLLLL